MRTHFLYDNGNGLSIETDDDPSPIPENPETDEVIEEPKKPADGTKTDMKKGVLPVPNDSKETSKFCSVC